MDELALSPPALPQPPLAERLLSDERLARLVSGGNERAFAALYARHELALSRYCRTIVRDEQDAQDALQNAMMHAFAALQTGERDLKVRPWLYRIVHNEAVSLLRRRRPVEDVGAAEQIAAPDGTESAFEQRERLAQLVADLWTLSERQRAALVMRELSGLSIEEIAGALATSPGAAKQTLFEARCALQDLAEGRAMECETVRRLVSEQDGRVLRGRRVRSHLHACPGCHAFRAAIDTRRTDLRALAPPLPALAASGVLARLAGAGQAGGPPGGGALAGGSLASGGFGAAGSLAVKALAGIALVTAASTGTVALTSGGGHRGAGGDGATPARHAAVAAAAPAPGAALGVAGALGPLLPLRSPQVPSSGADAGAGALRDAPPLASGPRAAGAPAVSPPALGGPAAAPGASYEAPAGSGWPPGASHPGGQRAAQTSPGGAGGAGSAHRAPRAHRPAGDPPSQAPTQGTQQPAPAPPPQQAPSTGGAELPPSPADDGGASPTQPPIGDSGGHASPHASPHAH
jgi:RNA polymerase sigma factor (sigma-70 family)